MSAIQPEITLEHAELEFLVLLIAFLAHQPLKHPQNLNPSLFFLFSNQLVEQLDRLAP
jgi:hypothetical protein